jgi:hypothetical protein
MRGGSRCGRRTANPLKVVLPMHRRRSHRYRADSSGQLDSSLKRHTALIKRMKQSLASENRDHLIRDIAALSLEKYIEEIAAASVEGLARCKTDKDVWSAVEVCPSSFRLHSLLTCIKGHFCSPPTLSQVIHAFYDHTPPLGTGTTIPLGPKCAFPRPSRKGGGRPRVASETIAQSCI